MAAGDEFAADRPTEPLPIEPDAAATVAPHVPIADPQTVPLEASQHSPAPRPERRPRTWLWVVIAALAAGAIAAIVTGILLGNQNIVPAPSPTISSPAATPSASSAPEDSGDDDSPAPEPPPVVVPSDTPAPQPTGDPVPTETPAAP